MASFVFAVLLLSVCCINCSTGKLDSENEVMKKVDGTAAKFMKAEVSQQGYPSTNTTSDRLERLEVLVNLLSEDVYTVRVDQEVMRQDLMARLEAIDEKLEHHEPSGRIEHIMATYLKDFRPIQNDTNMPRVHVDCRAALRDGWRQSGLYMISPDSGTPMEVFCDQKSSGGGWTVFQKRLDGQVDFDRSWEDYKHGFGELHGDFWLGNKNLHRLTASTKQQLRVELHYLGHGYAYAEFSSFMIGTEDQKYQLGVGGYTGTNSPGDSLMYHNDQFFSTRDVDHDADCNNCAAQYGAGWWFRNCSTANLNGVYGSTSEKGITWTSWMGSTTSLTSVKMMVRPADEDATTIPDSTATIPSTTGTTDHTTSQPQTTTAITTTETDTTSAASPTTTDSAETTPTYTGKDCREVYDNGGSTSGVYAIYPGGTEEVQVYCEQELHGGGWTVFQSRNDGSVNFNRLWADYKQGFGNAAAEHWLGNDWVHLLTANNDTQLLVELQKDGLTAYAHYSQFSIADENSKYRLQVSGFTNGLNNPGDSLKYHDGMYFSTAEQDHDVSSGNCAANFRSAWWYKACRHCDLNTIYGDQYYYWYSWVGHYRLTASRMMLRTK